MEVDAALIDLLSCPQCMYHRLVDEDDHLKCPNCLACYPFYQRVPVFIDEPSKVKVFPETHKSNQMSDEIVEWLQGLEGYVLAIGAGATYKKLPNCVELEYSIYKNTDVVCDAHHLPFREQVFQAVVAFNVFEHLYDPPTAAKEIFRVLKPGGKVVIHTAFMQPLHEEPVHYYNTTKYGLLKWFADFDIEACQVSWNFNPAFTISWLAHDILHCIEKELGLEARTKLGETTLNEWSQLWKSSHSNSEPLMDYMTSLSQSAQERFAAGFELKAIKPY